MIRLLCTAAGFVLGAATAAYAYGRAAEDARPAVDVVDLPPTPEDPPRGGFVAPDPAGG